MAVEVLFVPGMTARDYPRAAAPDLLFPDGVLGIPLRTAREEERDEEQLFEALKTRASRTLVLTASTHDNAGKTIVPSSHFSEVQRPSQPNSWRTNSCVPRRHWCRRKAL